MRRPVRVGTRGRPFEPVNLNEVMAVARANLKVAIEESAGLMRQGQPPEASVVLRLKNGREPNGDVVQGIAHLVAGSVDGIDHERVTVLDQSGRLLSSAWEPNSPAALASRERAMRRELETYQETKAEQIVSQIVGAGNARVQISAEINHDRVERTVETVD